MRDTRTESNVIENEKEQRREMKESGGEHTRDRERETAATHKHTHFE